MMGMLLPSTAVPVIKGATGLLALDHGEVPRSGSARIARCVDACPMGLEMVAHPRRRFRRRQQAACATASSVAAAPDVCPSHIPLVQYFQYAVGQQDERRSAARKNDYVKQLAEARAARAEEEAAKAANARRRRRELSP